jgi:hypothetical protein
VGDQWAVFPVIDFVSLLYADQTLDALESLRPGRGVEGSMHALPGSSGGKSCATVGGDSAALVENIASNER